MTKLSIGAVTPRYNTAYNDVLILASKVHAWGFDSLWVTDHLQPKNAKTILEPWTTITALSRDIPKLFLGTMALCYSYRHPAVLAYMATTLYHISEGRFILGIGAGSRDQETENRLLGIDFPAPVARISQLKEYLAVFKSLQKSGYASVAGTKFGLSKAACNLMKYSEQYPPLWIGGRNKLILRLAAQWGDGWNYFGWKIADYKRACVIFEEECQRRRRNPSTIIRSLFSGILVASSSEELKKKLRKAASDRGMPEERFFEYSATAIFGTPAECANQISEFADLGVTHFIFRDYDSDASNLECFALEVLPKIR